MTTESWKLGAVPSGAKVLVNTPYAVCSETKSHSQFSSTETTTTYFGTRPAAQVLLCRGKGLHDNVMLMKQIGRYDNHDNKPVIKTCGGYRESTNSQSGLEDEFVCVQRHAFHKLGVEIHNCDVSLVPRHEFLLIGVVKVPVVGFVVNSIGWRTISAGPTYGFERFEVTLDEAAKMAQDGTIYDECSRSLIMWAWMRAKEVETRELHELIVESALVASFPEPTWPTALVVFPGRGETARVDQAVRRFLEEGHKFAYLLVAGDNPDQSGARIYNTVDDIVVYSDRRDKDRIYVQGVAHNTLEQAVWAAEKLVKVGSYRALLSVSPYHLLRAYCTLVRALNRQNPNNQVRVWPMQMDILPGSTIPHPNGTDTAWEAGLDEIPRLLAYRRKGDIASHKQLVDYVNRLDK